MSSKIPDVAVLFSAFGYVCGEITPFKSPQFYIVSRNRDVSENYAGILFPGMQGGPKLFEPDSAAEAFSREYGAEFTPFAWGNIDGNRDKILRTCLEKNVPVYHMALSRRPEILGRQPEEHVLQEIQIAELPLE